MLSKVDSLSLTNTILPRLVKNTLRVIIVILISILSLEPLAFPSFMMMALLSRLSTLLLPFLLIHLGSQMFSFIRMAILSALLIIVLISS